MHLSDDDQLLIPLRDVNTLIGVKRSSAAFRHCRWFYPGGTVQGAFMKIHRLGTTGLKVSEICLGTMTFGHQCDEETSFAILDRAADRGVTFLDTADVYPVPPSLETAGRTEEIVGKWLQGRRDQFVLATKCRMRVGPEANDEGLSRRHILKAVEDSLGRLRTDYIDLYQTHSPDPDTPLEETLGAFDDLVRQGKVRYAGCSNYPAWQLALAVGISRVRGWARWDSVQPRYNLLYREIESELLPLCRDQGLGVIVYNPLAGGLLTAKYRGEQAPVHGARFALGGRTGELYRERYWHEAQFAAVNRLFEFFQGRGKSLTQVAIAWVLAQPGITSAIVGASRPDQLDESLAAADITLEKDEVEECDHAWYSLPRPHKPVG
jgi:aryl-alcohol dehydrogenase-like predicted oxidoreductase